MYILLSLLCEHINKAKALPHNSFGILAKDNCLEQVFDNRGKKFVAGDFRRQKYEGRGQL